MARDRQLLLDVFLVLLCIFGSTATTVLTQDAEGETNPQLGFITGFSVLVILITRCAISKYFITFTFDMFSKVALVLAVTLTGVALAILHYGYQSDFITYSAVGAGACAARSPLDNVPLMKEDPVLLAHLFHRTEHSGAATEKHFGI